MTVDELKRLKAVMRITSDVFDDELSGLVAAATSDLRLSGVTDPKASDLADPLIWRAVVTYVKAYFGWDNADHERLVRAYDMLKSHLTLSQEYTTEG